MKKTKSPIVVNIFGGPSIGKSTVSAGIFYSLKRMQVSCELATEFAKDLVWEKHYNLLDDQIAVFANQHRRVSRLREQVDVVVTDSPFILGIVYSNNEYNHLPLLMVEAWNTFNNVNIVLERGTTFDVNGRNHTEAESIDKDVEIVKMLDEYNIPYHVVNPASFHDTSVHVVDTIIRPLLLKDNS